MADENHQLENIQNLFSSTEKLFLLGAGCSVCVGLPVMEKLTENVLGKATGKTCKILNAINDEVGGNIENILSQLNNYIAVASKRIAASTDIQINNFIFEKKELRAAVQEAKKLIATDIEAALKTPTHHLDFVKAVHRTQRPGRKTNAPLIYYFILNYDTLIEDALGSEGISYTDGMLGGATAYWTPNLFDKNYFQAKVLKLHGSLDWYRKPDTEDIRRLPKHMRTDEPQLIIAPAESKYAETQAHPYTTLMAQFRDVLTRSHKDTTLFIIGYGFGDAHINKHIEQALKFNEKLTVVVLAKAVPDDSPVANWQDDDDTNKRLIVLKDDESWKFENFTKLIGESE